MYLQVQEKVVSAQRPARTRAFYYAYVVELGMPRRSVYVGSTGLPPSSRMWKHLSGKHSSRYVRSYGKRLRPDLAYGVGPFRTRKQARQAERKLAERLERRGYVVYGACRKCSL